MPVFRLWEGELGYVWMSVHSVLKVIPSDF